MHARRETNGTATWTCRCRSCHWELLKGVLKCLRCGRPLSGNSRSGSPSG